MRVLEFVRSGQPAPLGACESIKVHDLESNGLASDDRESLRAYARGVQSTDTAGLPRPRCSEPPDRGMALLPSRERCRGRHCTTPWELRTKARSKSSG